MDNHKLQMLHSSGSCDWRTPKALYLKLRETFTFDIDLAATGDSCLVVRKEITHDLTGFDELAYYLGPDHPEKTLRDALQVPWHDHGRCGFLNPPYSLSLYSDGLKAGVDRTDLQWLLIDNWARKAYQESLQGFTTVATMPYAPQTEWFRRYVMGHDLETAKANQDTRMGWSGHAALDYWTLSHRVTYLRANGEPAANANVNTCIVIWSPNPGFSGPWVPGGRYWTYR